ncbi:DUF7064 domain-containing protein [Sinimarinibacterium flocculans]|uniref:DUF7064 domain-containing protein n=1 Tax=Sinimarinibacterium flocculans TaxID=985250 RepID=UPI002492CBE7|nr:hypothetical protein [Sinimarinibacterium flocculans]
MIGPEDADFHCPPDADYRWAETNIFSFLVPEEKLMACIYTVSRPVLGVMAADIVVYGALSSRRAECLYIDSQQHLPAPARLSSYRTANGLSVEAVRPPRDYRINYSGYDDTALHVDFRGLMEPFDIHDPDHSPRAVRDAHARVATSGFGAAYGGHFDLTGHVTGTLRLRGREYRVDCVETMDHSWGPRIEIGMPSMGWMHAHFGPDFAIHWINTWDMDAPPGEQHRLAHGYVMERGEVHGLTDLKMSVIHVDSVPVSIDVLATDCRGREFSLQGSAQAGAPWVCYTSLWVYAAMMRWRLDDGRIGYGMAQETQSLQSLTRRQGRRWADPLTQFTT